MVVWGPEFPMVFNDFGPYHWTVVSIAPVVSVSKSLWVLYPAGITICKQVPGNNMRSLIFLLTFSVFVFGKKSRHTRLGDTGTGTVRYFIAIVHNTITSGLYG